MRGTPPAEAEGEVDEGQDRTSLPVLPVADNKQDLACSQPPMALQGLEPLFFHASTRLFREFGEVRVLTCGVTQP